MRYLRLYLHFLRFSFSKAMEFRVDFYFRIVMDCIFYFIQFLFFNIIYEHTSLLAGWNMQQMYIFIAAYIFIDAAKMTVFANNCWWFPVYVNRGDLDYYLTKPVSTLFFLSFREFAANSFLNLVISCGILVYAIQVYPEDLSNFKIFIFILLLINGTVLNYLMHLLFLISVFWTHSPRGFSDVFWSISHSLERPDRMYTGFIKFLFTYILPFALMASFPAKFLLEANQWHLLITIFGMTAFFFILVLIFWRQGLKNYTSASS